MRLFDSHVHLDSEQYDEDRAEVIARAQAAGVEGFVCVGAVDGFLSAGRALKLAEQYACVWASVGIHPNDAEEPFDIKRLRELASHPRVVAVGETGFDFYWKRASRESQERWFRAQIELALELDLPVIIHSREAAADCYAVLCDYQSDSKLRGVFHCFSEDAEFAHKLEELSLIHISEPTRPC